MAHHYISRIRHILGNVLEFIVLLVLFVFFCLRGEQDRPVNGDRGSKPWEKP